MKKIACVFCLFFIFQGISTAQTAGEGADQELAAQFRFAAQEQLVEKWYPLVIDREDGGYYSEVTYDFQLGESHDKMIVTQARHIWATSKAAEYYQNREEWLEYAAHGFQFLQEKMWDEKHGGFFNLVSKKGEPILKRGEEKTAYGNAFAIYALAAYHRASKNENALKLAQQTFLWLEENAHDPEYKGYFNILGVDGKRVERTAEWPSTSDVGYKDQNSSIHLLEAFTELYEVWPDELLRKRLEEMLLIIRDTITTEEGYMRLFFEPDWTPVSFRGASREVVEQHYYLDHVSFGHDVETAFLILEASHALGSENDSLTLNKGKKMVDHSLKTGWDPDKGGFYDGGYYFEGANEITILNDRKNWWAQAEGLNSLLLMDSYFPEDEMNYRNYFNRLWDYTKTYIIDDEYGGWYEWGIDKSPESRTALKGHIWKASYHNFRALMNCIQKLEVRS